MGKQWQTLLSWAPKSLRTVTSAMKLKDTCSWNKRYEQPRQHIKKQRHYFTNKGPSSQSYSFSNSQVWMWELEYNEAERRRIDAFELLLEKTLENPLDSKEIQPVHPRGNQSWIVIGRTDAEAEAPILWPPEKELTHLKRPYCWDRSKAGGDGDDRGWDDWMASPTQ